jgi:hypothetical protein
MSFDTRLSSEDVAFFQRHTDSSKAHGSTGPVVDTGARQTRAAMEDGLQGGLAPHERHVCGHFNVSFSGGGVCSTLDHWRFRGKPPPFTSKGPLRHDNATRQIIIKELHSALYLWMCTNWKDLVEEAALRSWEEARNIIFLRMVKSGNVCKMRAPKLPECVFGEVAKGISLMVATRQLRRAAHRWREM